MSVRAEASRIAAVVLAAGASSRLGRPKQLVLFGGEPLLSRAARAARACGDVFVVLGAHAARVAPALPPRAQPVHNVGWAEGIASSIRAGLDAAEARCAGLAAVVLMTCDQPFVDRAHVEALVAAARAAPIVASRYAGGLGVPALFARSLFPELRALRGDAGARAVIARDPARVASVFLPRGEIDVDDEAGARACIACIR